MMHDARRRRITGGLAAALATAGLLAPAATAAPDTAELPAWTHTVLAVALAAAAVAAALVATVWAVRTLQPHARATVRALRARHIRRRARAARRAPKPAAAAGTTQRRAALVLVAVVVLSVLSVSVVAVAINYAHGMDVARANHENGWRAWLYPIAADGLMIASSLVLVWQLLTSHATTVGPRIAFGVGIAASIGTNVLAALHTGASSWELAERVVWTTWPTFGLLASHEMLLMILQYYAKQADVFGTQGPSPEVQQAEKAKQAAEQRAIEAEQAASAVQAQATEAIDAAKTDAEQRVAEAQQEAAAQLTALHQQLDEAKQACEEHKHQVEILQREQNQREATLASLRSQLAEIEQTDDGERTAADYDVLRAHITDHVHRRRTGDGVAGSLTGEVVRIFGVSARWTQLHIPEATASRNRETEQEALQLAAAG